MALISGSRLWPCVFSFWTVLKMNVAFHIFTCDTQVRETLSFQGRDFEFASGDDGAKCKVWVPVFIWILIPARDEFGNQLDSGARKSREETPSGATRSRSSALLTSASASHSVSRFSSPLCAFDSQTAFLRLMANPATVGSRLSSGVTGLCSNWTGQEPRTNSGRVLSPAPGTVTGDGILYVMSHT